MFEARKTAPWALILLAAALAASPSRAAEPHRSWSELVTSNGFTGVVVSLDQGKIHHFREHLFAAEEPIWTDSGDELWVETGGDCFQPQSVWSRDLLFDAYFGYDLDGRHGWLSEIPVDHDASGYDGGLDRAGRDGGTNVVRMVQPLGTDVTLTTRVFAPWSLERAGFVMALEIHNTGDSTSAEGRVYGLVNPKVGDDRPGPSEETNDHGEAIGAIGDGAVLEEGFAGLVLMRPLDEATISTHTPADFFGVVRDSGGSLPAAGVDRIVRDDGAAAFEWPVPALAPGESHWVGLLVAHEPDRSARDALVSATDLWRDSRGSEAIWQAELDEWDAFQDRVVVPLGLSEGEDDLYRHSAAILRMAQVREDAAFVAGDLVPGTTRQTRIDGSVVAGGSLRDHNGRGALLASLPPGRWAYAWIRDGAYAVVGLTDAGLFGEAKDGLSFFLDAEADRYRLYDELSHLPLAPYAISLTRYFGFGIEESDTLCGGDFNFEFDGFGLFLWALRHYVEESGDDAFLEARWPTIRDRVAEVIDGLREPGSGLIAADSSIWEVHWGGKEKHFAYTSITAARGLCDAAWLAERIADVPHAAQFREAGAALIDAIHVNLRDGSGAIAANTEELATGSGYWDAAVLEAINFGLYDPTRSTAEQTLAGVRANLTVTGSPGLARNDDENDPHDLTPWGSGYDSIEWVFIDLRASIAARHMGDDSYADAIQGWVRDQSLANYLLIAENYDTVNGDYRNNVPMIGFGAGSYITAMRQRAGHWSPSPACGAYFDEATGGGDPEPGDAGDSGGDGSTDTGDVGEGPDGVEDTATEDGAGQDAEGDSVEGADVAEDADGPLADRGAGVEPDDGPDDGPDSGPDSGPNNGPDSGPDSGMEAGDDTGCGCRTVGSTGVGWGLTLAWLLFAWAGPTRPTPRRRRHRLR